MSRNVCKTFLKFTSLGVKKTCKSKLITILFLEGYSTHLRIDQAKDPLEIFVLLLLTISRASGDYLRCLTGCLELKEV